MGLYNFASQNFPLNKLINQQLNKLKITLLLLYRLYGEFLLLGI